MDFKEKLATLKIGDTISNNQIHTVFNVSTQGGMRKSNANNCLVLIAKENGNLYPDKWDGDTLLYTGMGKIGDQSFYDRQNKTLFELNSSNVRVFLFVQTSVNHYTYYGPVKLAKQPYYTNALDEQSKTRRVAMFPLTPISNLDQIHRINQQTIRDSHAQQTRQLKKQTVQQLSATLAAQQFTADQPVSKRIVAKTVLEPNPIVIALAKKLSAGICQLCRQPAPFKFKNEPYLEVYYLTPLANGGVDELTNAVALCPNCHQKMKLLNEQKDLVKLKRIATQYPTTLNND
ncbi:HNH endonuclease [Lactobacillaceae bacterium Scapto_B20]